MSDILASIDDAIEAAKPVCACGCGAQLGDSVSEFFAGPDCQQRWHEARATDPDDVYDREDAAAYPMWDAARVPVADPRVQSTAEFVSAYANFRRRVVLHDSAGRDLTEAQNRINHVVRATTFGQGHVYVAPVGTGPDDDGWTDVGWIDEPAIVRIARDRVAAVEAVIRERMQDAIDRMAPALEQAFRLAAQLGHEPEPTDPRERALAARRNRNTGPRQQQRAPRRIDPRRSR